MASIQSGAGSTDVFITRRALFDQMKQSEHVRIDDQVKCMKDYVLGRTQCPENFIPQINKNLSFFMSDFKKRWQKSNRKRDRFLIKNQNWLDAAISFPKYENNVGAKQGRPKKSFHDSSDRTKRQKTETMRTAYSHEELAFAAHMSLRSSGLVEASQVVKEVTASSPTRAAKYRKAYKNMSAPQTSQLTGTEALAMCVDAQLTTHQYNIIRAKDKIRFPSYKKVQAAKKECYPPKDNIIVTDTAAEVKLQALLDHTASRLLEAEKEALEKQTKNFKKLLLICKWGFDGSAQSQYKQKFSSNPNASDANVFISSFVPIRLISGDSEEQEPNVIWQNERTSSTRYCRPIRFQFEHETADLSKKERDYIEGQIGQLQPMAHVLNSNTRIEIRYRMLFTMVDGKVCNALTETTSTQRCFICGLTSKDFNNIEKVLRTDIVDTSRLEYGLSVLHARIRFFECLLHLSYKLPLKKWQVRGNENKQIMLERKKNIQEKFRSEMGLLVDKPKPGFGSTNDGNTSRRFFEEPELSASITGVDIDIIRKFKILLHAISSAHEIDVEKYRVYALETARLFVEKYSWYPMPPTVHKVLIHGPDVIEHALVPIGQLSEEAQEARNKEFRKYRDSFSRKISRSQTNEDILNLLLISSDPLISSLRKVPKKKAAISEENILQLSVLDVSSASDKISELSESSDESDESTSTL